MFDFSALITTLDDLPNKSRKVAEIIGLDNYLTLCERLGGKMFYLPSSYKLARKPFAKRLLDEYENGAAAEELSDKYGVTLPTVYNLLGDAVKRLKNAPMQGQVSLYDVAQQ